MKHVNGDMEDLFRRAAAKYPLRADSADWDRLAAALDKDPGPPSVTDKDNKRRRRAIFWWWLLLPLAVGLSIYSWRANVRPSAHLSKVTTQAAGMQAGRASATGTVTRAGEGQGSGSQTGEGEGSSAHAGEGQRAGKNSGGTDRAGAEGSLADDGAGSAAGRKQPGGSPTAGIAGAGNVASDDLFDALGKNETGSIGAHSKGGNGKSGYSKGGYGKSGAGEAMHATPDWTRARTGGSFSLAVDVRAPARKDSIAKQVKQAKQAAAKPKGGHGYIGITGAPDLSTVKMQAMKGVGTTWGLVMGYAFNSRWAVESGVYLDRKKYYTAGEYFNMKDPLPYPLKSVNGNCNMWEIPLNVRYNFNPGSKISWFATAGASSYFMTKQQYTYQYESGYTWPSNWNWSTSVPANYLFSVINLSGGFEQRIGRIGNLRIEPYLRIPVSGIGTGRLPIMSGGLNIGVTRQLW